MNKPDWLEKVQATEAHRERDGLCRAAAEAAGWGGVTKQRLSAKMLDELIRLNVCDVRYDATDRSRLDWYPVNPEFIEKCRDRARPGPFGGEHMVEIVRGILREESQQ